MQFVSGPEVPVRHSHADPIIEMHRDCVYVPILNPANFWENTEWGLYDRDGCNIDSAAFYRYGKREGQSDHRDINLANIPYAPRKQYFYVGHVFNHYGHFICSTMARLWALSRYNAASMPLIGHAAGQPRDWFSWPHARTLFGSAGVMHEDFAHFDSPVRIRELIIARPAFVEGTHIHTAYARSMNYFGERLVKTENIDIHNDLIYLAKTKFGTKAAGISNENLIIEALEELGVQIVHPEQLTIPQQIALFHKSKKILGQVGSAFHTNVFIRPRDDQSFIAFNASADTYSANHALIDAANGNPSRYVYSPCEWREFGDSVPRYEILNPRLAAQEIVDLACNS